LLETLRELKNLGNSVIVVEHDEETITQADHVIDIGPAAGPLGGKIIAQGTVDEIKMNEASAKDILAALPNPPSYSAIRATVNKLEKKGYLAHRAQELKYIYFPTVDHKQARISAIQRLLKIFFDGSTSQAVTAMLDLNMSEISAEDLEELDAMIDRARIQKTRTTDLRNTKIGNEKSQMDKA
jgi:predicted transcriptional regulator